MPRDKNKIRRYKRRRIISSSDSEKDSDPEPSPYESTVPFEDVTSEDPVSIQPDEMLLDPDVLGALGDSIEESSKLGEKIHDNLARLWTPILRKGLSTEAKDKLMKQFLIPENCPLLQAPKLNPEILAATSEISRFKDKRVEMVQQQLGVGITAVNRALVLLLDGENTKRLETIKLLSDGCRILCDIHHTETEARKKFVTPGLDKCFLNIVQELDRDDMLFGSKLSEKIKASKAIEKQGLQIKKPTPNTKPSSSFTSQPSTSRPRSQVNWTGPPRYPSTRGGRGGSRRTNPAGSNYRKAPPTNQTRAVNKTFRPPQQR